MSEISISTRHHQLRGYWATPNGKRPWPGVIVLHDVLGLTDVTRGHADWLAKEGYLAVAPDGLRRASTGVSPGSQPSCSGEETR